MDSISNFKTWLMSIQTWTCIWILVGLLIGIVFIHNSKISNNIDFTALYIWAFAFFLFGALTGCIFGVPKVATNGTKTSTTTAEDLQAQTSNNVSIRGGEKSDSTNNLTEISDWLTKIVIGAGLVELKQIPAYIMKVANRMAKDIDIVISNSKVTYHSSTLCAGVIVYYTCFGLIAGYFVMRSIFLDVFKS